MAGSIAHRLLEVRRRINRACERSGRSPDAVKLVAVSKTFPVEAVLEAHEAGQDCFGESRLQEAQPKVEQLSDGYDWHFIGRVQRNKVRKILRFFHTIHGIDSLKLAEHADRVAGELGVIPKVFFQVNIGREESKGGFDPDQIINEAEALVQLRHLHIQGLMCIPPHELDSQSAKNWFAKMRQLKERLEPIMGADFSQLSMGMSGDYEAAIEEGATVIRVGSAIFGGRS